MGGQFKKKRLGLGTFSDDRFLVSVSFLCSNLSGPVRYRLSDKQADDHSDIQKISEDKSSSPENFEEAGVVEATLFA